MRRQALLNLFMLVLAAALALVVLFGPQPDPPPESVVVGPSGGEVVNRIELTFHDSATLAFVRREERWALETHPQWPIDVELVGQILALPEAISHARYSVSDIRPKELGLQAPRIRLRLNGVEYQFGAQESLRHHRYLRVGDTVHLITDTLIHRLSAQPVDWVDRRVVPRQTSLVRLELPDITLSATEDGRWRSEPSSSATPDAINAFVDRWRYARALAVETAQRSDAGERIRLILAPQSEPLDFQLIRDDEAWFLQRPDLGLRYRFESSTGMQLLMPEDSLSEEKTL